MTVFGRFAAVHVLEAGYAEIRTYDRVDRFGRGPSIDPGIRGLKPTFQSGIWQQESVLQGDSERGVVRKGRGGLRGHHLQC